MNFSKGFTLIEIVAAVTIIMILFVFVSNLLMNSLSDSIRTSRKINLIENSQIVQKFYENEIDSNVTIEAVVTADKKLVEYKDFTEGDILTVFYASEFINTDTLTNTYKVSAINFKKSHNEIWIHKYNTIFTNKNNLYVITANVDTLGNYEIANYISSVNMQKLDDDGNFKITLNMEDGEMTYTSFFTIFNSIDVY